MADRALYQIYFYFRDVVMIATIAIATAIVINYLVEKKRVIKLAMKLPGPPAYPLIGNALKFACKSDQLLQRIVDVITPYVDVTPMRLWMGPTLYVVIVEPRDIEIILNSQLAANKGSTYKFLYPFIGDGLISGSGKSWKIHRKMVSHILNQRTLDSFVEAFNRHSKKLVEKLKPMATGDTFDVLEYVEGCTIDIVCETIMGYTDVNALNNPNYEFIHYTAEMYKIVHDRMMKVWLYPDWIFQLTSNYDQQQRAQQIIRDFTERCIKARREDSLEEISALSILERLLMINDVTNEMTDDELRDEIYTVYIASQDTLAVISSFTVLMLGIHQVVQDKARAEVNQILQNKVIDAESLSKLKYMEMIIKETLRLFPIAPLMVRQLKEELKLEHCTLPKSCQIVVASYVTHRSKHWREPEKFIPERFNVEETAKRHPYSFIPFSSGPMGCIGQKFALMSLKAILANILRKYTIKSNDSLQDIKLRTDISIRSINGYNISLQQRDCK